MRAYDCIKGATRIHFKRLLGKKHVLYCIAMKLFLTDLHAEAVTGGVL